MPDKLLVRFLQRSTPYNPGETAGFLAAEAQELVNRGIATFVGLDESGELVPTVKTVMTPGEVTAKQTAAGLFPRRQAASRAPTNSVDDATEFALGSEGTKPDVALSAKKEQEEKGKPEPDPLVIPAVEAPASESVAPSVDGPAPVESGTPEEAERAQATLEATEKAEEELAGEGDEPKKRGRPRKDA